MGKDGEWRELNRRKNLKEEEKERKEGRVEEERKASQGG